MKNFFLIPFVLLSNVIFSQNPELFDVTWNMTELTVDGEIVDNIVAEGAPFGIVFGDDFYSAGACNARQCFNVAYDNMQIITSDATSCATTLSVCAFPDSDKSENAYFNVLNQVPIRYAITSNTDEDTIVLTLTNASDDQAIFVDRVLSLDRSAKNKVIVLAPNPFTDTITITSINDTSYDVMKIYDVSGKLQVSKQIPAASNLKVDLSNLSKGIYFIELLEKNTASVTIQKLVKN